MRTLKLAAVGAVVSLLFILPGSALAAKGTGLWKVYNQSLSKARYIDLTHDITPNMPVWKGFGPATFKPSVDPTTGTAYTYAKDGFEATAYEIATDPEMRTIVRHGRALAEAAYARGQQLTRSDAVALVP